jgi:hypothetical protein
MLAEATSRARLDAFRIVDLRPVLLHLDLDVETDLLPHLDRDLTIGGLVGVIDC